MAAIMLSTGISPKMAARFACNLTLADFNDFPGALSIFQGNRFEELIHEFLQKHHPQGFTFMEDATIPVAVSALDIQSGQLKYIQTGSMARAARASATVPLLFQPVAWTDDHGTNYLFVDGGIMDGSGLDGLSVLVPNGDAVHRVINLQVTDFRFGVPLGPSALPFPAEVLSISIRNLPDVNPLRMENAPSAVAIAEQIIAASFDVPLHIGREAGHYELHLDAANLVSDRFPQVT